jgi:hypothetical protein
MKNGDFKLFVRSLFEENPLVILMVNIIFFLGIKNNWWRKLMLYIFDKLYLEAWVGFFLFMWFISVLFTWIGDKGGRLFKFSPVPEQPGRKSYISTLIIVLIIGLIILVIFFVLPIIELIKH